MKEEYAEVLRGERRYDGEAKTKKLKELANEADHHRRKADEALRGLLEHAKAAGDALRVAQRITGKRGKWGKWVDKNFHASRETARVYMRVSKKWNDPRIQDAMAKGVRLDSIKGFFDVIKGIPQTDPNQPLTVAVRADMQRDDLRKMFAAYLRQLDRWELSVFDDAFANLLGNMHADLRQLVCFIVGDEHYKRSQRFAPDGVRDCDWYEEQQETKRIARAKGINKKRIARAKGIRRKAK